ncbi:MAG TPA: AI-2E family transporter, partial [Candidatus Onthosoma merdavium]|nr:AI-2E family transporter [Candidatus Onthosoma merdavium]
MKVRYSEEMKKQILVYSTSGGICILLYFIIAHFAIIREAFYYVSALAFPFILGFAIAFLL